MDEGLDQGLQDLKTVLSAKLRDAVDLALPKVLGQKLRKYADTHLERQVERVVQKSIRDLWAYGCLSDWAGLEARNTQEMCKGCTLHTNRLYILEKTVQGLHKLVNTQHTTLKALHLYVTNQALQPATWEIPATQLSPLQQLAVGMVPQCPFQVGSTVLTPTGWKPPCEGEEEMPDTPS